MKWHVLTAEWGAGVLDGHDNTIADFVTQAGRTWAECERLARLVAAAPALLKAAKLTVLCFKRSQASGNFQGDDEHEAWTALNAAIAEAKGG